MIAFIVTITVSEGRTLLMEHNTTSLWLVSAPSLDFPYPFDKLPLVHPRTPLRGLAWEQAWSHESLKLYNEYLPTTINGNYIFAAAWGHIPPEAGPGSRSWPRHGTAQARAQTHSPRGRTASAESSRTCSPGLPEAASRIVMVHDIYYSTLDLNSLAMVQTSLGHLLHFWSVT